jgi:DNA-binding MarR family transcriptional regulator
VLEKSINTYIEYSRKITRLITQKMTPTRKKYKLTKMDTHALLFFSVEEHPPTASEFSRYGSYSKSNVSKALLDLSKKKLVTMESNKDDRRYQEIQLTEEGKIVAKELRESIDPIINKLSDGITPEQRKVMFSIMARLRDNMSEVMKEIE